MLDRKICGVPDTPVKPVDMILDTDTYNEIDDQFAIAYMLHSPEMLNVKAITAAPFFNGKSTSPADGMEKSYQEILKLLKLDGREDLNSIVYRGAAEYLPDENTPVVTDAAKVMVEISKNYTKEDPLYIAAIGAITNVASALLMDPTMAERVVVIFLGGNALTEPDTHEFNMMQDIAAARVVFGCEVPLVQLPCAGVVDHLLTTEFELRHWLEGKTPLADYLAKNTIEEAESYAKGRPWSRVIWDISTIAWLLNQSGKLMQGRAEVSPIPEYDHHYGFDPRRKMIHYVYKINRDEILEDLFTRILK